MAELRTIFGLSLHEADAAIFKNAFKGRQGFQLVTSLARAPGVPGPLLSNDTAWEAVLASRPMVAKLTGAGQIEDRFGAGDLHELMVSLPETPSQWMERNLSFIAATKTLFYIVDEQGARNLDLTVHLTFARLVGALSVGILPKDSRAVLDTTQMVFTDAVVGEVEPRALTALLLSLKEETE